MHLSFDFFNKRVIIIGVPNFPPVCLSVGVTTELFSSFISMKKGQPFTIVSKNPDEEEKVLDTAGSLIKAKNKAKGWVNGGLSKAVGVYKGNQKKLVFSYPG